MANESNNSGGSQFSGLQGPGGISALEDKVLGPSFDYSGHIKSPEELGMSSAGNFGALADDISGLLGYIDLMVTGSCSLGACASKKLDGSTYGRPLGNKFFLDTAVQCEDKASGNKVTRSIYINNVPDGQIPFVSNMGNGVGFSEFKGIMPGIMSNIAQIHPMQILTAFVNGSSPTCQAVTMPTVDAATSAEGTATRYIINTDIDMMPSSWFTNGVPAKSTYDLKEKETFCNNSDINNSAINNSAINNSAGLHQGAMLNQGKQKSNIDYSKMPNDIIIKFYYSALGLLGLYILLRLMYRRRK
jgi:hypothetical protein